MKKVQPGNPKLAVAYGQRLAPDGIRIEEDPGEQALLLRIRHAGAVSLRKLMQQLAAEGFTNRRGKPLAPTQVYRIQQRLIGGLPVADEAT